MSVFIIAEAGVNHNGSLETAKALVDAAVEAGADAVKFQTFKAHNLVTESAEQAAYQTENTGVKESQFSMLQRLELDESAHRELLDYCAEKNIEFMSTPFDAESVELLNRLGMKRWKIPSGEVLSVPYLRQIAKLNQPTILSTGMSDLDEVAFAVKTLLEAGLAADKLSVLHANTAYPTPFPDVNLRAMQTLQQALNLPVGLSDHSLGIEVPIAAVALGARVIEKHFTLDKHMPGPDHKASLEPDELKAMVTAIRHVEQALGSGLKEPSASEQANIAIVRKRIVAKRPISSGEPFSADNCDIKRSSSGEFAQAWDKVMDAVAQKDYHAGEGIEL
ncbi:N-acetylneuraminate synthase [Thiomicrorhabdus xiamenensis]|uniref:N-acetylneuraminate synthase n=1 Tax=Thiomicrorhabdus xiamenensis TaxID=2739063 RepID=A0A7D4NR51_9GAMM|nr:N-acetylneuraminate synthase [Thiomicrorhabdus xiamenensis]QKI89572.1 N-acetylneuraminate synthase [Thiomicrorhabdus xiamenensis]